MSTTDRSKVAYPLIGLLSAGALAFLTWLLAVHARPERDLSFVAGLPLLNACLNALAASLLLMGYVAIRYGLRTLHGWLMRLAFGTSALFLISYITYHWYAGDTRYHGPLRALYLTVLASHVLLSVVALPLVLLTLWYAWQGLWPRHRRIARYTLPIWLYVSVTGVLVYLMLHR